MAFNTTPAPRFIATIYGSDTNEGDGIVPIANLTSATSIDISISEISVVPSSGEGEVTSYINDYQIGSTGFRWSGIIFLTPTFYNPDVVETFSESLINMTGGGSINTMLDFKYTWLKFPDNYNRLPDGPFDPANDAFAVVIKAEAPNKSEAFDYHSIAWSARNVNGVT